MTKGKRQRKDENISADIEKWLVFTGSHEVSFMVSFKVRSHPITSLLFLSVYGDVNTYGKMKIHENLMSTLTEECKY